MLYLQNKYHTPCLIGILTLVSHSVIQAKVSRRSLPLHEKIWMQMFINSILYLCSEHSLIPHNSKHNYLYLCSIPINKRMKVEIICSLCSSWLMASWEIWRNNEDIWMRKYKLNLFGCFWLFADTYLILNWDPLPSLVYCKFLFFSQFSQASSYYTDVRTIFQVCTSGSKSHS